MKSDNPPRKHHFSPVFHLKQWAGSDGRVCEMRKFDTGVVDRRKHPTATGFAYDLYKVDGVPEADAQRFESVFMRLVDNHAERALQKLLNPDTENWDQRRRSAWASFIMSLLYRHPHGVKEIREVIQSMWRCGLETLAQSERERFERDYQHVMHIDTVHFLQSIINNPRVGETLVSMQWSTIFLDSSATTLLTSDRPLYMPLGLDDPNAHIVIPIAPRRLFVAAHDRATFTKIRNMPHSVIVKTMNLHTVMQAREYVWGVDVSQLPFVRKHIGKTPERIIVTQEQKDGALDIIRKAPKPQVPDATFEVSPYWESRHEQATAAPASLTGKSS